MTTLHRELPRMRSMSEFIGGNNDTCGPDAEVSALSTLDAGYPLSAAQMSAIRQREIAAGWFNSPANGPGIIVNHVRDDLAQFEHVSIVAYMPYAAPGVFDTAAFHAALVTHAGLRPIIIQVADGRQLPGNEQSGAPISHFVVVEAIDSALGYAIANGDDVQALAGNAFYPVRWSGWSSILAAGPVGLIAFERGVPAVSTIPRGWTDSAAGDPASTGILKAPDGTPVVLGFRAFILTFPDIGGWRPDDVPLETEHGKTDGTAGTEQVFARSVLEYDPATGVTQLAVGRELLALRAQLEAVTPNVVAKSQRYDEFVRLAKGF